MTDQPSIAPSPEPVAAPLAHADLHLAAATNVMLLFARNPNPSPLQVADVVFSTITASGWQIVKPEHYRSDGANGETTGCTCERGADHE